MQSHKYMMLACAVFARECYHCAALSKNIIDINIVNPQPLLRAENDL